MDLRKMQAEVQEWAVRNFGEQEAWRPLMGVVEETGECAHHELKRAQGIRGDEGAHVAGIRDAVGDIVVYLMAYCEAVGVSLEDCVEDVWAEVQTRDWKAYPVNGRTE